MHYYLGEAAGNARVAFRMAGFSDWKSGAPYKLLRDPRIQAALGRGAGDRVTKDEVVRSLGKMVRHGTASDRLRAAKLLAEIEGWLAPTKQISESTSVSLAPGPNAYLALAQTLRVLADGGRPIPEGHRIAILKKLDEDADAIEDVRALLNGHLLTDGRP